MGSCKLNDSSGLLYDIIRKRWVKKTPEEVIRQMLLQAMVKHLGFPSALIAVEKELRQMPHLKMYPGPLPDRRADVVCFSTGSDPAEALVPLLLVECKEELLNEAAKNQVLGYNAFVQARFVALANAKGVWLLLPQGEMIAGLPRYGELLQAVSKSTTPA